MHTKQEKPTAESLVALVALDAPIPIRAMFGVFSRSSFYKWKREGLQLLDIPGAGKCVRPSELKAFLDSHAAQGGSEDA